MKILNMAHGSLYALGAYAAASLVGAWFTAGLNPLTAASRCWSLAAIAVGLVAGPLIERGLLRFMYGSDEIVLVLVTYAVFLILEDVIKLIWGVESYFAYQPYALLGSIDARRICRTRCTTRCWSSSRSWSASRSLVGARPHAAGQAPARGDP